MLSSEKPYDVIIVGAGPAGLAAAICCATAGLKVIVCESGPSSRERPAESLHPGCLSLIDQLGFGDRFRSIEWSRYPGIEVAGEYHPFGEDSAGPWLGYHINRVRFDSELADYAETLGVEIRRNTRVLDLICEEKRILGISLSVGEILAPWVIDATGRGQWAASKLGLKKRVLSAPLMAWRGEVEGQLPDLRAKFSKHGEGWLWTAQTGEEIISWTMLAPKKKDSNTPSLFLAGAPVKLPSRGYDVTWQAPRPLACPGLLIAGDAAALLDPAAGQGVFFALESGQRAAQTIVACFESPVRSAVALAHYDHWVMGEFERKVRTLTSMYRDLKIEVAF